MMSFPNKYYYVMDFLKLLADTLSRRRFVRNLIMLTLKQLGFNYFQISLYGMDYVLKELLQSIRKLRMVTLRRKFYLPLDKVCEV